ncbi:MAG: sporulation transcriptional regulator SpoIIID [Clostridia bacterium]|nr:sporulation transcriptional regulator SpoIIID [Clostridia bacterium]
MKDYIEDRVMEIAQYIIDNNATVRSTAKVFSVSKSTVHKDVHERLIHINMNMYGQCRNVLEKNKAERHIRGGLATREKYKQQALHSGRQ